MQAKLYWREGWPKILKEQDGVGLLTAVHFICNQQDGGTTGLLEIVTLERSLALNAPGQRSGVKYL